MRINFRRVAVLVAAGLVAVATVAFIGRSVGKRAAEEGLERVLLLWPDLMSMPQIDRGRIAGAAMFCNVHNVPVERGPVVQCLRKGAEEMRERDAIGAERVHELLDEVQRPSSPPGANRRQT